MVRFLAKVVVGACCMIAFWVVVTVMAVCGWRMQCDLLLQPHHLPASLEHK